VEPIALIGLVGLLLIKEVGVPVPVPGDLLVIGAGAALAGDAASAAAGLGLILAAGYVGGTAQFALVRRAVREPLLRMLARVGVSRERVEALANRLRRTGARGVAISRMTPGVRIGSIAASGIADLPTPVFVRGLVVGNAVFVSAHFALGLLLGVSAGEIVGDVGASLLPVVSGIIALAVIGAGGWMLLRRRRARRIADPSAYAAWSDAACPACLAVALLDVPDRERT
jgi:membrane protein DedA with SNARE-associated domain